LSGKEPAVTPAADPDTPAPRIRQIRRRFWPFAATCKCRLLPLWAFTTAGPLIGAAETWRYKVLIDEVPTGCEATRPRRVPAAPRVPRPRPRPEEAGDPGRTAIIRFEEHTGAEEATVHVAG
jgi:hypothetical protein